MDDADRFTNYTVMYYKPDNSPQLLARKFPTKGR
jgi:hypothetical protein